MSFGISPMRQIIVVSLLFLLGSCSDACSPYVEPQELAPAKDLEPDASPRWQILDGLSTAPKIPCAATDWNGRIYLVHEDRISVYAPKADAWTEGIIALPGVVGSGVAVAVTPKGRLFVFRGGKTTDFWSVDLEGHEVSKLAACPKPVGRGAALAWDGDHDRLYAIRGDLKRNFWRYDPAEDTWTGLTRVGDKTRLAAIGQSTGGLQYSRGKVYAWPDHHIQRYDIETATWLGHVHMSYGQRPWWDGGMYGHDRDADVWYIIQGLNSRTLSVFDPNRRKFAFLRPRLPLRMSGEGNRAVVVEVDGKKWLYVYAVLQGNRLLRIALDDLEWITNESPASDVGSPWITFHERGGSSLVRRPAFKPVLGLMGKAGDRWYFGRLKNLRFLEPAKNKWTRYPGVPLGGHFEAGLCATADERGRVYVFTGNGRHAVRVDPTTMKSEPVAEPPADLGLGAQCVLAKDGLHLLVGGERRDHFVMDVETGTWETAPPLPGEAMPVGEGGSALLTRRGRIVAISGAKAWELREKTWKALAALPFPLSPDGGMAAVDPKDGRLFCVEGGGSRRMAVVEPGRPVRVEEALLPDVVSVAGQRALVDVIHGQRVLCVHRGHDTHEILVIPTNHFLKTEER